MPATRRHVSPAPSPAPEPERHAPGERLPLAERQAQQLEAKSIAVDLDELFSDDLFAVISQRRNGQFSFAIFKGFKRVGSDNEERTSYIPAEKGESYLALAKLVLERIDVIRKSGKAPFQERR